MSEPLHSQHALVTGGGRGIGRAIAAALTEAGATVTVLGRNRATSRRIPPRATPLTAISKSSSTAYATSLPVSAATRAPPIVAPSPKPWVATQP